VTLFCRLSLLTFNVLLIEINGKGQWQCRWWLWYGFRWWWNRYLFAYYFLSM